MVSSFYLIGALLALVSGAFSFYFYGVYMGFFSGAPLLISAPAGPNINNYEVAGGKEGNAINSIAMNKFSLPRKEERLYRETKSRRMLRQCSS